MIDKYGLKPEQIIDMKGLMGDSADNIPGVPGIGEKTAVKILTAFPTVEAAYEHLEEVEPKRARELLRANPELAKLSKQLATIKTDCEIDVTLEDAKLENLFTSEAFEWIKRLELKSLFSRFDSETVQSVVPDFEQFTQWTPKKEWNAALDSVMQPCTGGCRRGVFRRSLDRCRSGRKRQSKKGGGQMSLVFTEDSVELGMEQEDGEEYGFIGFSLSYYEGEDCHTGYILVSEEVTGNDILDGYHRLEKKGSEILLLDWKNALHLTKPVEVRTYGIEPAKQHGFALDTKQERKKTFASLRDLGIGAYLLNPLKDTYQADDIARDYLHMTLPSYQELFGKETLAAQLARIDEEETGKTPQILFRLFVLHSIEAWAEDEKAVSGRGNVRLDGRNRNADGILSV